MRRLLSRVWCDDTGAVLSVEWTLLTGLLVAGVVPGVVAVRDRVTAGFAATAGVLDAVNYGVAATRIPPPPVVVNQGITVVIILPTHPQPPAP